MLALTIKQKDLLTGGLLGDLHIQKSPASTGKCRLRFCHSVKQKEYLDWKYNILKDSFCKTTKPPYVETRRDGNDYLFYTGYLDEFIEPHRIWYPVIESPDPDIGQRCVKKLPLNLEEELINPLALAVWYLDDGTKRTDTESCRIATQSFSKEEHILLQDCLHNNFNISAKIEDWGTSKSGEIMYSLAILSQKGHYKKFRDLIYDIVKAEVPSMLYKL